MPIISAIGRRSWKVRATYAALYAVLSLGAITMVYPFLLMLTGSMKSEADINRITPYPEFWFSDRVLFQKYAESKHNAALDICRIEWNQPVTGWRFVETPPPVDPQALEEFLAWRKTPEARTMCIIGHKTGALLLPCNARLYRETQIARFKGDLTQYCRETGELAENWNSVFPPASRLGRYRNVAISPGLQRAVQEFAQRVPATDDIVWNPEGCFVREFLIPKYTSNVAEYNRIHGTAYACYEDVRLPRRAPDNPAERRDWENFVRINLPLDSLRLDADQAEAYRAFLAAHRYPNLEVYNTIHGTHCATWRDVPFVRRINEAPDLRVDWEAFIKNAAVCPVSALEVYGPQEMFEAFRVTRHGEGTPTPPIGALCAAADYHDCMSRKSALRWEFTTRNYRHVLSYIALHGNGIFNTILFCLLAVGTALVVNPLAAYALSRFKLPGTYKILLFFMATMAFPNEVNMIPGFILLKRFPLWPILGGVAATLVVFLLLQRLASQWSERRRGIISGIVGILVGAGAMPLFLGTSLTTVSLLNTFAALILPGAANGFSIFLLKGFFDSLPRELYEAAEIDGAGEWCKFWTLTMCLSKPILAVIALGAFTAAYTAFMMALVIIPDPRMWTIMVWIYQLQTQSHGAVVYASLVLAAIPTLLIFAVCQNIIIRGIVVPTEK